MLGFKNYGNKFLRKYVMKILLPDGELNPGLPRDRWDTHHYTIEDK